MTKNKRSHISGLTLLELLVVLVLSTMVLAMLLPLLSQLLRPSNDLNVNPETVWSRAIAADLREIVSPSKAAIPVVRVVSPSESDPMQELVIETFCRIAQDPSAPASRSPTEVRYRLEAVQNRGPFALVRYSQGWHDSLSDREVLTYELISWNFVQDMIQPADAAENEDAKQGAARLPVTLHVKLIHLADSETAVFCIPQDDPPDPSKRSEVGAGGATP